MIFGTTCEDKMSYLLVKHYRSKQVILHAKTDLILCDRKHCPIYKRKPKCSNCMFRVLFHNKYDRRTVKIALSMLGRFRTKYVISSLAAVVTRARYSTADSTYIVGKSETKHLDWAIRILMHKILMNIVHRYTCTSASIEAPYDEETIVERIQTLAYVFVRDLDYNPIVPSK